MCETERDRERESVCVCERESDRQRECVCLRERESVRVRERERTCVCGFVYIRVGYGVASVSKID